MKRKLLIMLILLATVIVPAVAIASTAYANDAKAQVLGGVCQAGANCSGHGVYDVVAAAVNILSIIVGIVAVIAIINSGFKYITSGGDAGKVGNAKSTLIYALVGVAIAALAQVLVHFVLNRAGQF